MLVGNLKVYGVIYKITNLINKKVYIGQTTKSFNKRYSYDGEGAERVYKYYKNLKEKEKYYNYHLLNSMEKYGVENFKVDKIIDVAFSKYELDDLEGNEIIMCGNEIYNKGKEIGFFNINKKSFEKYILPYNEVNIENIKPKSMNQHTKRLIENLTPFNGWKVFLL